MVGRSLPSTVTDIGESSWLGPLGLSDFVAVRVETSGLDPASHEIIEIGAVRFTEGLPAREFQTLIRAAKSLDPFITDLTGITDEDLNSAPSFADVAPAILAFLEGAPLVGHNLDFDLSFLRSAAAKLPDLKSAGSFAFADTVAVDTQLLTKIFWPEQTSFTLPALATKFGVPLVPRHRALDDARAIGQLVIHLVQQLPQRVWRGLAEDLNELVSSTTHRSRPLFEALVPLCAGVKKPQTLTPEEPTAESESVIDLSLERLFGKDGIFEQRLSFFKTRPAQLELTRVIESALAGNQILLAEAPTGIGKSLAYLAAALRWIEDDPEAERQVVVSSHTKVLQDQLCRKDIGELRRAVGGSFQAEVLKGRANYLCRRRLRLLFREARERLSETERIQLMSLLRWAEVTETGDVAEINSISPRTHAFLWSQISSDAQACAGSACSAARGDFYRAAQERAARAQIVFVNHALLFTDLARFAAGSSKRLILDEAHQVERAMVGALTFELSAPLLRGTLSRIADDRGQRGLLPTILARLPKRSVLAAGRGADMLLQARSLHVLIRQHFASLADRLVTLMDGAEKSGKLRFRYGERLHTTIGTVLAPLLLEWNELTVSLRKLQMELSDLRGEEKLPAELLVEFRGTCDVIEQTAAQVETFLRENESNRVMWVEFGRTAHGSWCTLFSAPISIGALMEQSFWPVIESAVLTSATLSAAGDFSLIKESLGLTSQTAGRVREISLPSPFRLSEQMLALVPLHLPEPRLNGAAYTASITDLVTRIVERYARGTLVLCTSNDLVERITSALAPVARRAERRLLSQGASTSLAELIVEFRRQGNAILVGAASFWEGIDVVGEALQILVVSRIPFDVPTDPWVSARSEMLQNNGHDPFQEYSLPNAALRLKQGLGRLIRHPADRGVAILTDPRLFRARYGRVIRDALPTPPRPVQSEAELFAELERFFGTNVS